MVKKNQTKVYIVEDILDTKLSNGVQFYRVKWKGYSFADCTWEPEESFNCSKDILNTFLIARAHKQPAFSQKLQKIQKQRQVVQKLKHKPSIPQTTKMIKKAQKKPLIQSSSSSSSDSDDSIQNSQQEKLKEKQIQEQKVEKQPLQQVHQRQIVDQIKNIKEDHNKPRNQMNHIQNNKRKSESQEEQSIHVPHKKIINQEKPKVQKAKQHQPIITENNELDKSYQRYERDKKIQRPVRNEPNSNKNRQRIQQQNEQQSKYDKTQKTKTLRSNRPTSATKSLNISTVSVSPVPNRSIQIILIRKQANELRFYVVENNKKVWKTREQVHKNYARQLCQYYEKHLTFDE